MARPNTPHLRRTVSRTVAGKPGVGFTVVERRTARLPRSQLRFTSALKILRPELRDAMISGSDLLVLRAARKNTSSPRLAAYHQM